MRLPRECYQMQQVIETHLTHLSGPQLTGLVWWVCGTIQAGSSGQNAVATALSTRGNWNSIRQYLREWLYDGRHRAPSLARPTGREPLLRALLRWVLVWWRSDKLALAIDPTLKGTDTTAIVISVVYRSCAIPVAWRILRANKPGAWMDPIVELLQTLAPAVAAGHERDCAVRPGPDQSETVAPDLRSGLASLHQVSEKRHLLRRWRSPPSRASLRFRAGYRVDWDWDGVQQGTSKAPLHVDCGLVR